MKPRRLTSFILVLVSGSVFLTGCTKTNHAPVISSVSASPSDSTLVGGSPIALKALATDEDGDVLSFVWRATAGNLSSPVGDSTSWTATGVGSCTVSVTCTDGGGLADTMFRAVRGYRVCRSNSVQGETPDSTFLAPAATTYVPFELDEPVPDGAVIDSAFVCTDLEPDTVGEYFRIWVVTPAGSEVLVYDGLNGEPDVDDFLIQGIKGEPTKGTWRLKVTRDQSSIERYADVCDLDIYYHY